METIPISIIFQICDYLDFEELAQCAIVNKKWNKIFNDRIWLYLLKTRYPKDLTKKEIEYVQSFDLLKEDYLSTSNFNKTDSDNWLEDLLWQTDEPNKFFDKVKYLFWKKSQLDKLHFQMSSDVKDFIYAMAASHLYHTSS